MMTEPKSGEVSLKCQDQKIFKRESLPIPKMFQKKLLKTYGKLFKN